MSIHSVRFLACALGMALWFTHAGIFAAPPPAPTATGRNLALLTPGAAVNLRMKDDQVITDVQLVSVDEKFVTYRKEAMTVKTEREQIYRANQAGVFYSDLQLSAEDHEQYSNYLSYIHARGDIIVDFERQSYVGKITGENEVTITIRTRAASYDVEKRKISAWRRDGVWYGDEAAREEPGTGFFNLRPFTDRKRVLNYSVLLTGPWVVLPQLGAGLGSNVNWPIFGGVRSSIGYVSVDAYGLGLMIQGGAYLNVNLLNFGSTRLFAGTNYLWRAAGLFDYGARSSATYRTATGYASVTQNIYTLHAGLKYKSLLFEAGAEMPIYASTTYRTSYTTIYNAADQLALDQAISRLQSTVDTFNRVSRVYFMVGMLF